MQRIHGGGRGTKLTAVGIVRRSSFVQGEDTTVRPEAHAPVARGRRNISALLRDIIAKGSLLHANFSHQIFTDST